MKYTFKTVTAILLLISMLGNLFALEQAIQVQSENRINESDILAEFDGGTITRGDLLDKISKLQPQVQGRYKTAEGQIQVLDVIATEELFYKKAIELGMDQDPAVVSLISTAEKQFLIQEFYRRNITEMGIITDQMKREYYANNQAQYFVQPNITIDYMQAAGESQARDALARLQSGISFREVSDSLNINSYARGLQGRIRNVRLNGNIPGVGNDPQLEELIRNAETNSASYIGPVQTSTGWHILRKVEMIPGYQKTYEEVEPELEQRIRPTLDRDNLNALKARLMTKYNVVVDTTKVSLIDLRRPDESLAIKDTLVIAASNSEIRMTIGDLLTAFSKVSPQEQVFYTRGDGVKQLIDQELIRNLLFVEAKAQNYQQYLVDSPDYQQMRRYHILSNAYRRLVREQVVVTSDDAMAYYNANIESYQTPPNRAIQVLWFTEQETANRAWSLFNLALRTRNEAKMTELITRYSTQPERSVLENQYNNGTVTGVGPDQEFSRLIWATPINGLSPVFTTAQGNIVFFRVLRESEVTTTPFTEIEPRIQGTLKQQKEKEKQDQVIQELSVEYHLRKYPERITLMLSAEEMFELANSAAQQRNYNDAIVYYDQIIANYKNNIDDYKASFMKAFLISEEMNDKPRALELFRSFLRDFPAGDLHESAQFMLDVLEGRVNPDFQIED